MTNPSSHVCIGGPRLEARPSSCVEELTILPSCSVATQDQTASLYLPPTSIPSKANGQWALPSDEPVSATFSSSMLYSLSVVFLSLRHSWGIHTWCQLGKQAGSLWVLSFLKYLLVSGHVTWSCPCHLEYQTRVIGWSLGFSKAGTTFCLSVGPQCQGSCLAHSRTAKWEAVRKLHRIWN